MAKCSASAVVEMAKSYVGYLEKASNSKLDDFTANAGTKNYTKFNRDYLAYKAPGGSQPMEWCGAFVSCMFAYTYGIEAARKLLCGDLHCYTPNGAKFFKNKKQYIKRGDGKPQMGDVVFFYSAKKGRIGHVGIVEKVTATKVHTIEGNTSGASTLITNGGGVMRKSYALTSTYIDGYGRPDYAGVDADVEAKDALELGDRDLFNGCEGDDVKELQEALILLGYDCGKWGADGDYGDATEMAVEDFQFDKGLEEDGIYGAKSHAALVKALADLEEAAKEPRTVRIVGGNCWIRTAPNTKGKKLCVAKAGTSYVYGGDTAINGWNLIEFNGQNAWVSGKYSVLE